MILENIPIIFSKKDKKRITKLIEDKIKNAKEEFYKYITTEKPVDIKYEIKKVPKGYYCEASLYYGKELVRKYDNIDELFLDLNSIEADIILKSINVVEPNNEDRYKYIIKCTLQNSKEKFENQYLLVKNPKELDTNFEIDLTGRFDFNCEYEVIDPIIVKEINNVRELLDFCKEQNIYIPEKLVREDSIVAGGEDGLLINDRLEPIDWLENIQEEDEL